MEQQLANPTPATYDEETANIAFLFSRLSPGARYLATITVVAAGRLDRPIEWTEDLRRAGLQLLREAVADVDDGAVNIAS